MNTYIRCGTKLFAVESILAIELDTVDHSARVDTAGGALEWRGREADALRQFVAGKGARRKTNVPGLGTILDLTPAAGPQAPRERPPAPAAASPGPVPATPQAPDNGHRKEHHEWGPRAAAPPPARDPSAPRTGKALFAWAKEQDDGGRLLKYLLAWGRREHYPDRIVEWGAGQAAAAHAAAVARMRDQSPED